MQNHFRLPGFFLALALLFFAHLALAHEAYVLTPEQFNAGLLAPRPNLFTALANAHNLRIAVVVDILVAVLLLGNAYLKTTVFGVRISRFFERGQGVALVLLRLALAGALFASAYTGSFLAPELLLSALPFAVLLRWLLFIISAMLAVGFFTELAALVALVVYLLSATVFGWYVFTYANYLGEMVALALFGSRLFSFDGFLRGKLTRARLNPMYETLIIRVCYGAALIFAAINIKWLHPALTQMVVTQYNLTQFHWLFPTDQLFLVLGAAIAELTIGVCILIGFQVRLINVVVLFYMTLSLFFFHESVWPHLMLIGLSLALIFSPDAVGVDYLVGMLRNRKNDSLQIS